MDYFGNILFFIADCTNELNGRGLDVLRMPNELIEIMKLVLWLKFERASDSSHLSKDQSILLQQYKTFRAKHGRMTNECLQTFGIPMEKNVTSNFSSEFFLFLFIALFFGTGGAEDRSQ